MSSNRPLQFKISSWKQLPECESNNDRNFHITLSEIHQPPCLDGFKISVVHPQYGVVFTELLNARGTCITGLSNSNASTRPAFELDTAQILQELRKFGFYIVFQQREQLPKDVLEYLNVIRNIGFDKLRVMNVHQRQSDGTEDYKWYVIGFKSCKHGMWLNNSYSCSHEDFTQALLEGTCINISEMSSAKKFNWSWLDFVANIDDILKDNLEALIHHGC